MDVNEIIAMLTDGLPADQAAIVKGAIERDAVKAKVGGIKAQREFEAIEAQRQQLAAELEGANGQPGSRAYQKWYSDNFKQIEANSMAIKKYDEKHGQGAFATAVEAGGAPPAAPPAGAGMSKDDIKRLFQEEFKNVAPNIAGVVKGAGRLVQRHMYAGRKTEIDFETLDKLMGEKNYTLEQAYDEWDKPEREKVAKATTEAEIERRVKEEVQKRGATSNFPAGADLTPSSLSSRSEADVKAFDRGSLNKSLLEAWVNPEGATQ